MKVASGNVLWRQRKRNWCRTPFTFTVYTLTDRELSVKTGILNERFNLIKLFRIVDISVERTFLQRIFGMSTLVLDTRDQSSGNGVVALKNVINGFEVRQVLQEVSARNESMKVVCAYVRYMCKPPCCLGCLSRNGFVHENYSGDSDQYLLAPEPMKFTWKPRW